MVYLLILQTRQKRKKEKINLTNKDDKYFQYMVTVALYYQEIKWNPEKVLSNKQFVNKYKW